MALLRKQEDMKSLLISEAADAKASVEVLVQKPASPEWLLLTN